MHSVQNVLADCSAAHGCRPGQGLCTVHKDGWPSHCDSHELKVTFCLTSESPGVGLRGNAIPDKTTVAEGVEGERGGGFVEARAADGWGRTGKRH